MAAAINHFRLPLFFEAEFLFGQFLVLLIALYRGPLVAVLAAIIASIPLDLAWGSLWATLTLGLEALFVAILCRRNKTNLVLVVIVYWLLIGMPLSWISIADYDDFLDSHKVSILIKQLTNAIIYANMAAILILVPWIKKIFRTNKPDQTISLKEQSSHLISTLLITVGVLFFFYNLNQNIKSTTEKFSQSHVIKHQSLEYQISLFINSNLKAINEFRYLLSQIWEDDDKRKQSIVDFNERFPVFNTMVLADDSGKLINSSPPELVENVLFQNEAINISDRDYFTNTINRSNTYVSPGFVGRGFGSDLIAAVSVSVPSNTESTSNLGVIEGTFILKSMEVVEKTINNISHGVDAVIVDQNNQVLMASEGLDLNTLADFKYQHNETALNHHNLVNLILSDGKPSKKAYYYSDSTLDWGWKLVTLQNECAFAEVIEKSLIYFAVTIIFVAFISKILAGAISYSWSYYLQRLNNMITKGESFTDEMAEFDENDQLPEEVRNFYHEIRNSRQRILKMNIDLQNTIAERTEKLQKANTKLNYMARHDDLTGLENRRVFNDCLNELWVECQRELLPLSMLILDVDHFKKLNDTFGHPVGDQILAYLGKELKQFKRSEVRSISRLGGEEFCLLLKGSGSEQATQLAEQIRKHINDLSIPVAEGKMIEITVSIGVATIDATKLTTSRLYQLADDALYQAKGKGRNVVYANQDG
jgi:diguanylate cyclase (GGDEF)-like protein